MRRRVKVVFALAAVAFLALDGLVLAALWPQLRTAEALSTRYAANSRLLARMRGDVHVIRSSATQRHVDSQLAPAEVARVSAAEIAAAQRDLDAAAVDYDKAPMDPAEAQAWGELSRELLPRLMRSVERISTPATARGGVDQEGIAELGAATTAVDGKLQRLAQLNATGLDDAARAMHAAVAVLVLVCVVLGLVGIVVGTLLVRSALAALTEYERSTEERLAELEQFAGRVAHDLRNPLQTMGMSLELIHRRAADERTRATAEKAQAGARRMAAFIQELLEFARSGAKPDPGASAPVADVLHAVEQDLAASAASKDVALDVRAPAEVRAAISPEALRAIVSNLADNAVKHMPAGADARRVELAAEPSGQQVRIVVSDNGAGIAPEVLPRIFEPFFRAGTQSGSFGIGLKTVKRLVDAHGGRIDVESAQGRGSVFTVTLPAAQPPGTAPRANRGA